MKVTRSVRRPAFTVGQLVSLVLVGLLLPLVNIEAATATVRLLPTVHPFVFELAITS